MQCVAMFCFGGTASVTDLPLIKEERAWYCAVTRLVLSLRNSREHSYAYFAVTAWSLHASMNHSTAPLTNVAKLSIDEEILRDWE